MMGTREKVFNALVDSFENKKFSNIEIDVLLRSNELSENDKSLFTALFLGVIERKITLDYIISRYSDIPRNELDIKALVLLEMGIYQILYMDKIPDSAAVNECVAIAEKHYKRAKGFINAILRKISADRSSIPSLLDFSGKKGLSLKYSYPKWLIKLWSDAYGEDRAIKIMEAQNSPMPLSIKINETKIKREEYLKKLDEMNIGYRFSSISKKAVLIDSLKNPRKLFGFDEGYFIVQDPSPQYAIEKLDPESGDTVLDICASPGGKSFASAIEMNNIGHIVSCDLYPKRVELIKKANEKLGLDIISEFTADATKFDPEFESYFDKIICDVPCSGYGVISKKPDIKLKSENDSILLPAIQKAILSNASKYLKIGGRLLYSTCTLSPEENDMISDSFLAENKNFKRIGDPETVFPNPNENDGFFIDIIERTK